MTLATTLAAVTSALPAAEDRPGQRQMAEAIQSVSAAWGAAPTLFDTT